MHENQAAERLSLDGTWQINIEGQSGAIIVPGVWEVQGFPRNATHAVLERTVEIPEAWRDARILLNVGAASYDATFFVNGQRCGQHQGLWTPFEIDVTAVLRYGEVNTITCEVIKPSNTNEGQYPYREVLVGFVPYVSSTFGGIWQSIELVAHRAPAWTAIHVLPDAVTGTVQLQARLENAPQDTLMQVAIYDADETCVASYDVTGTQMNHTLSVPNFQHWHPDNPYLYTLVLRAGDSFTKRRFGFRRLHANGQQLLFNGAPVFLRGILSWGWNPDTLAPTFSDDFIREEFARVRRSGFNLYKLCLYVPPENVLRIADEEGMLLWLELPMWLQRDNPHLRDQLPVEYADILARVHHHPSIVLYSLGCEIHHDMISETMVRTLETLVRQQTIGILLCENSGSGEAYNSYTTDIADFYDYHFYSEAHYFSPLIQHFHRDWRTPRPWIFGEFAAMDAYRDPARLVKDGRRLWWRDLFGVDAGIHRWAYCEQEQRVAALKLPFTDAELVARSQRQSFALRKLILEATRARAGMGGYVITGLRDTPIMTSGLWDDHLQPKYAPDTLRQINDAHVLLLEMGRRRIWIDGDRPAPLDKFNHWAGSQADFRVLFSGTTLSDTVLRWTLTTPENAVIAEGETSITPPPLDASPHEIARIGWQWADVNIPQACVLRVSLGDVTNQWDLWVYPSESAWREAVSVYDPAGTLSPLAHLARADLRQPSNVIIASVLTDELRAAIEQGANAILLQAGHGVIPTQQVGFWQESLHLFYDHALWHRLSKPEAVTEQFYSVASGHAFDPMQTEYVPIMRRLHTRLFTATDYIMQMSIGRGQLIGTTLNLFGGAGDQATGLQDNVLGAWLLAEMVRLMSAS